MSAPDADNGGTDGLRYHGMLPVAITPLAEDPADAELVALNAANEGLLSALRVLNEKPELDDADQLHAEVRRLDYKLSLLLDLLSQLIRQTQPLPALVSLVLESRRLQLQLPLPEAPCYRIELFLDAVIPTPLRLCARKGKGPDKSAEQAALAITLDFFGVGQQVQDGLDRFLFRHHRRQVAQRLNK